jgi:hypothetical protein
MECSLAPILPLSIKKNLTESHDCTILTTPAIKLIVRVQTGSGYQ